VSRQPSSISAFRISLSCLLQQRGRQLSKLTCPLHCYVDAYKPWQVFDVAIYKATKACGEGHLLINGQTVDWSGNTVEGAGIFPTALTGTLDNHEVKATWKASCVANEAQIFSFHVQQVGEDLAQHDPGFTISFKQQDQPEVLRVVAQSIDIGYPEDLAQQWTRPDRPLHFKLAHDPVNTGDFCLDDEYLELEALKAQAHELKTLIEQKKHRIYDLLRDDLRTFCSTIKKCDSLKCVFQATMHKLPEYAHIISLHFRHHRPLSQVTVSSEENSSVEGVRKQGDEAKLYGGAEHPDQETQFPPSTKQHDELDSPSPEYAETMPTALHNHEYASPLPIKSQTRHLSPTPTSHPTGNDPSSSSQSHYTTTSAASQFNDTPFIPYLLLTLAVPPLFFLIFVVSIILLTLRRIKLLCASARSQASRFPSREECCTRGANIRAEFEHAWRDWWNRYRRPTCNNDYEEKRTLILEQETVLEDAMQDEIRGLRVAQEIVGELVRAEEGRSRLYYQANLPQHQRSNYVTAEHHPIPPSPSFSSSAPSSASAPTTETSTLGRYRRSSSASSYSGSSIPPPQYEEELEGDIEVVDGFTYSPTFGHGHAHAHTLEDGYGYGDDSTPDSSVVDCSPRMSFDTGRTTLTAKERD
jgi:hypothetical protein